MGHAKPFTNPLAAEKEERQMTRKQNNAKVDWKALMSQDEDFMKGLIQEVVQQVLEAEMDETLQAGKSERCGEGLGYRRGSSRQPPKSCVGTSSQLRQSAG